jgi:thiol:disulfide interchange protein DsbC
MLAPTLADQASDEAAIRKALGLVPVDLVTPTPVAGIYEVVSGPHIVYMSADGRYMFQGELMDVLSRKSLTEPRRRESVKKLLSSMSDDQMIIYQPEKVKHTITVFTDIDCGYCRKLHSEMDQYLDAGIRVRYLMYPRAGKGSPSYDKAVAVWCAEDRNTALTESKKGKAIEMKTCDNPIDEHMELVQKLGARGTPFIILENGQTQPGYVPAKQMALLLDKLAAE